jgi:hypothetical protein
MAMGAVDAAFRVDRKAGEKAAYHALSLSDCSRISIERGNGSAAQEAAGDRPPVSKIAMRNTKRTVVIGNGSLAPSKVDRRLGPPPSNAKLPRKPMHYAEPSGLCKVERDPD